MRVRETADGVFSIIGLLTLLLQNIPTFLKSWKLEYFLKYLNFLHFK